MELSEETESGFKRLTDPLRVLFFRLKAKADLLAMEYV